MRATLEEEYTIDLPGVSATSGDAAFAIAMTGKAGRQHNLQVSFNSHAVADRDPGRKQLESDGFSQDTVELFDITDPATVSKPTEYRDQQRI